MDTTAEMKKTKMLYGILRPMSTQWEWFDKKLNLSIMQDYVSESQWEIDTTEDATTDHGYQTINHSKWIKKHDRALIECVSLTTGVDLYVNEEGALHGGLHPSVHVKDQRDANIDGEGWNRDQTLRGTVIAVRHDEMGDTVGLYPSDKKSLELSERTLSISRVETWSPFFSWTHTSRESVESLPVGSVRWMPRNPVSCCPPTT